MIVALFHELGLQQDIARDTAELQYIPAQYPTPYISLDSVSLQNK